MKNFDIVGFIIFLLVGIGSFILGAFTSKINFYHPINHKSYLVTVDGREYIGNAKYRGDFVIIETCGNAASLVVDPKIIETTSIYITHPNGDQNLMQRVEALP